MTQPGIEPRFPGPLVNTLPLGQWPVLERLYAKNICSIFSLFMELNAGKKLTKQVLT